MQKDISPKVPGILMLYGHHGKHPFVEDMFMQTAALQADFEDQGFRFDIGMALDVPQPGDRLPTDVLIAPSPRYNQRDEVVEAHFRPGKIQDYPIIIDHWVSNFQAEVPQPDGTYQRTAFGVGLPATRLWNHMNIQTYGNRKDLMDIVLQEAGIGVDTWNVLDFEKLGEVHGDTKVIFKPIGGSRAIGIEVFPNLSTLRQAIRDERLAKNGLIQPYIRHSTPIEGLEPANDHEAELLAMVNASNRMREIRMHTLTTIDEDGQPRVETFPILKFGKPDLPFMQFAGYVALNSRCIPVGSRIYDGTVAVGKAVSFQAGGEKGPMQWYGAVDWLVDEDMEDPERSRVGDANARGPGNPAKATAFRTALVDRSVEIGIRNFR